MSAFPDKDEVEDSNSSGPTSNSIRENQRKRPETATAGSSHNKPPLGSIWPRPETGHGVVSGVVSRLSLCPITLTEACKFVIDKHRHHRAPQGGLFAVACSQGDEVVGVAIIGRPVARMLADGYTAEVTRLATDGSRNACSMLYSAAWRACRALGYKKLVTYILDTEPGTSLAAAGWKCVGEAGGGKWSRASRPRVDLHPTQGKLRFEMSALPHSTREGA